MADGEIVFSFEVDSKKAQAELDRVGRKMQNLADKAKTLESLKLPLEDEAKRLGAELDNAKAKLVEMQSAPAGQYSADQIAAQQETVASLQTQWDAVTKKIEQYNGQINAANASLQVQQNRANELAQTVAGLKQQEEEAAAAAEKQAAATERTKQIAEGFKTAFSGIGSAIFQGVSSGVRRVPGLLKNAFSAGVNAAKTFGRAVSSAMKNLNVFSKLTDALHGKFKRLGRTIKSALVFSVIYKGLGTLKTQIASYLSVDEALNAALGRLKSAFLTAFQPIYDTVVPALTTLVNALASAVNTLATFTSALFGTTASQAQANAKALYEQAEATESAGSAAEDAAGTLAGFDEINKLSDSSGGGGSASTSTSTPQFDAELGTTMFDSWGEAFSAFLDNLINNGLPKLQQALLNAASDVNEFAEKMLDTFTFDGVADKIKALGSGIADALNKTVKNIDWNNLGSAIGAGINTAVLFVGTLITTFNWLELGSSLAQSFNGMVSQIDWRAFGELLFAGVKIGVQTLAGFLMSVNMVELASAASNLAKGFFDSVTATIASIDWQKIGEQIRTLLVNIDWAGVAESVATAAGSVVGAAFELLWGFIKDAWGNVVDWWYEVAYEDGQFTIGGLLQGIWDGIKNIAQWIKEHIFQPFIDGFKKVFGIHSPSKELAALGKQLMTGLKEGIIGSIENVITGFRNLWDTIKGWWQQYVAPVFTIAWWKEKFSVIGEALAQKIKDAINTAISLFNTFIDWINEKMHFSWDDIKIGGKTIVQAGSVQLINIPNIPYLASGAVIPPNREFLAVLGDQKSGTNIEAPLSTIKQAVAEVLASMGGGNNEQTAYLVLDELVLGKVIYRLNKAESNRIGVNLAEV